MSAPEPARDEEVVRRAGAGWALLALRRAIAVAVWLVLLRYLVRIGNLVVPDSIKVKVSLQTYLIGCQIVTLAVGLGVALLLLRKRAEGLGLERRPGWAAVLSASLGAPFLFVVSSFIAIQIALPTLVEELQTRGARASQQNAGEFGRALTQAPIWTTLLWGPVLAAIGEALFFRGLLWSAITDLTRRFVRERPADAPAPSAGARAATLLLSGGVATVLCAALFGAMHNDLPGGVGIMRVASTTCLGLGLGVVRQATRSVLPCIALHAIYDTLAIGAGRRWFAADDKPVLDGIPNSLLALAVACALAMGAVAFVRALMERRARAAFVADSQRP